MKCSPICLLLFVPYLLLSGCSEKQTTSKSELIYLEFQRGEIVLCGGSEFGEVNFAFSCEPSARESFNLAISLLHSFEYDEAEKAFVQVIDTDPDCAMAYWGVAMSIYHSLWKAPGPENMQKGLKVLLMAEDLPKSQREKEYIHAIASYFKDWDQIDHQTRALKYEKEMEKMYQKYSDDKEAAIFYALALNSTAEPDDKQYVNQRKAGKILESIFPDQPNHPGIAHYIIHNYDNPDLAHLALSTARQYANIAPSSAHAQHMPSHIFTRLGYWQESILSNLNSASSAQCYAGERGLPGNWSKEIHALAYLVYAYLQQGDNQKAEEQYQYLQTMKIVSPNWDHRAAAYPFAAIPVRIALENKQWERAAKLKIHDSNIQWALFPWEKAILHFGRALGASNSGNLALAEAELLVLDSLHQKLLDKNDQYKADQVLIQLKASEAYLSYAKGNQEEAVRIMKEAVALESNTEKHAVTPGEVIPARELLGDMLLEMNKPEQALEAYQLNLKTHPNRFNGIYGAAMAAKSLNDQEKAAMYFEALLKLAEGINSDRQELEEAKVFLRNI